ncbi:g9086 [Coccomyxa elongata]
MASTLNLGASFSGSRITQKPCSRAARAPFSCRAHQKEASQQAVPASVKALAAGFAAALLVSSSPAHAGVKFEKVVSKKVFQNEPQAAAVMAPKAEKKSSSGFSLPVPSLGLDAGTLALPGAVVGLGALGVLATKLDDGFADFFSANLVKDSNGYAGYEQALKAADGISAKAARAGKSAVKAGTKKIGFKIGKK